ncbi:alanine racemase [Salinisphaera sp. PC39]|uniref:alanine racemase n=1 Tax=Salinisphaera sp. PC39 TaxID=1304156 RepID=UPI0033411CE1
MSRVRATVDAAALRHNLARVRACAPGCRVVAAIKADAYGHGAFHVVTALADADAFAVATVDEALQLRWAGVSKPLIVLSAIRGVADLTACAEHGLQPVLHDATQLAALAAHGGQGLEVWIKLDTGMNRLGFPAEEAGALHRRLAALPAVRLAGWMTHLACADDPDDPATMTQVRRFHAALGDLPGERSIANSAGILAWPDSHADNVRPGIMLYGASPLLGRDGPSLDLRPAMTLTAPLVARKSVAAGEAIGYGATWRAPEDMPVGLVAIGYGDGYPRHAPSGTPVLVHGKRVPLVGRVSMDLITVDLRDCPEAEVGDEATLWGEGLPVDEVAAAAGTIAYELFCRLTNRVEFVYIDSER